MPRSQKWPKRQIKLNGGGGGYKLCRVFFPWSSTSSFFFFFAAAASKSMATVRHVHIRLVKVSF